MGVMLRHPSADNFTLGYGYDYQYCPAEWDGYALSTGFKPSNYHNEQYAHQRLQQCFRWVTKNTEQQLDFFEHNFVVCVGDWWTQNLNKYVPDSSGQALDICLATSTTTERWYSELRITKYEVPAHWSFCFEFEGNAGGLDGVSMKFVKNFGSAAVAGVDNTEGCGELSDKEFGWRKSVNSEDPFKEQFTEAQQARLKKMGKFRGRVQSVIPWRLIPDFMAV